MADCPHEKMFENRLQKAIKIARVMQHFNIRNTDHLDALAIPRISVLKIASYDSASDATWELVDLLLSVVQSFKPEYAY